MRAQSGRRAQRSLFHALAFGHQLSKLERDGFDLAIALAPRTARYRPAAATVQLLRERWTENLRYEATPDTTEARAREVVTAAKDVHQATIVEMFLDGLLAELPA